MDTRIAADVSTPRRALAGLCADTAIHGVTDGSWSLIDAIREMLRLLGPSDIVLATWTAAAADLREAERLLRAQAVRSMRLIVDRSFQTRQPGYCDIARQLFGDDAVRVWSSHCKFCIVRGDEGEILYLTSANLNRNKRVENFSAYQSAVLCAEYLALIDRLYQLQRPGEGFDNPACARHHTEAIV